VIRLRATTLVAALLITCAHASAPISLRLLDPAGGAATTVEPGAPLLHLVFFATWCPPCLDELDGLAELEARWEESGYRLVLVAVQSRHTPERLVRFAAEQKPPGRLLYDDSGKATASLAEEGLPTHILVDAAGDVLLRATALEDGVADAVETQMRERGRQR
jgi:thiol-disulfide isomerase/thioredoxin